ncbi:MAG: NAD(+)/NADH kinase [Ruminococcaceae bacterium]|nr:NAD(+)/NADH kinase [Oscillospiraceae bacterium]
MRVAILPNRQVNGVDTVLKNVCEKLNSLGIEIIVSQDTAFPLQDCEALVRDADMVLALGGDGTLIHAAKHAARYERSVLGINCGHLGFMAGMEAEDLTALERLTEKELTVSHRMMLEVTVHGAAGDRVLYALNEAVLSRGNPSRMIRLSVQSDGKPVASYRADGVIVATPTGSTAYSLSAGGPVVDPTVNCLLMTPICPHSLHTRPYIFGENVCLTLHPESEGRETYLTVDGEEAVSLTCGDTVTVRRSILTARIVQLRPTEFYEVLGRKLTDR